jgi:hypothetical protein
MQTIPFLPNHQQFDPEIVRSMSVAYANVCRALGLSTEPDPATEMRRRLPSRHRGAAADPSPTRWASVTSRSIPQFWRGTS